MNVASFFQHWGIAENPFRAEEARQDAVFERLGLGPNEHPDFEKILGQIDRPSTAIVFGEKGSGKTAIRLQIARHVARHNEGRRDGRALLVAYDDLNPILDRFAAAVGEERTDRRSRKRRKDEEDTSLARLRLLRLTDHMDALLHVATKRLVDAILADPRADPEMALGDHPSRRVQRAGGGAKRDLMLLQACYDRPDEGAVRSQILRRRIRAPLARDVALWSVLSIAGAALPLAVIAAYLARERLTLAPPEFPWLAAFYVALGVWTLILLKRLVWQPLRIGAVAARLSRSLRVMRRTAGSYARSLARLPRHDRSSRVLPLTGSDEQRYAMFERLRRVAGALGFSSILVVVDRIDEPTLVGGDPDRMQAVAWPMLNNKFLQMGGYGFKLLLPIELRHSLFRESTAFFQSARLDKQNFIERLTWTGATLYDLCNARLQACRPSASHSVSLVELFDEDVSRQDLVDALDQMHQPRDAFKFLYQCIQEHCSNVTEEQPAWRIPRVMLELVRKQQTERVQQFYRGLRPA